MLPWLATKRTKFFAESEIGLWHGVSLCNSSGIAGLSLLCYWLLFSLLRAHSAQLSSVHSTLKIVPTRPWLTGPWNGRRLLSFSQRYIYVFQVLKLWQNNTYQPSMHASSWLVNFLYTSLYTWFDHMICFDSELFPQNFVWQLNNDQKSLDLYYECLK